MINQTLRMMILAAVAVYGFILLFLLKRKRINLKYSLLWILSGILLLLFAVFPELLFLISEWLGIATPSNALFAVSLFCIIMVLMSLTVIVTKQNEQIKKMAQYIALLEKKMRDDK